MAQEGSSVEQHAERAARKASPWIERLARVGYVAYGVVYVLVGVLAVQSAFGGGGGSPDDWTARLLAQPFGPYILGAVALGLVAYGVFTFVVARYRRIEPA